eukprot:2682836-Rhodomonas_salina.1
MDCAVPVHELARGARGQFMDCTSAVQGTAAGGSECVLLESCALRSTWIGRTVPRGRLASVAPSTLAPGTTIPTAHYQPTQPSTTHGGTGRNPVQDCSTVCVVARCGHRIGTGHENNRERRRARYSLYRARAEWALISPQSFAKLTDLDPRAGRVLPQRSAHRAHGPWYQHIQSQYKSIQTQYKSIQSQYKSVQSQYNSIQRAVQINCTGKAIDLAPTAGGSRDTHRPVLALSCSRPPPRG